MGPAEQGEKGQTRSSRRQEASEARRQAILDAALDIFAVEGFAAARLDDVAARAGVAKGTIYLFFRDKEDLFEQIILGAAKPVLDQVQAVAARSDVPFATMLGTIFDMFRTEVLGTRRKEIIRLVIVEGRRFPRVAEFYHREVISRGLATIRGLAERAHDRGELSSRHLIEFPQLVVAPLIMSLIWDGLFSSFEPLDLAGLMHAHRAILTGADHTKGPQP